MTGFASWITTRLILVPTTLNFYGFGGMTSILLAFTELEDSFGEWFDFLYKHIYIGKYNVSKCINFVCKLIYSGLWTKLHLWPSCPFPLSKDELVPMCLTVEHWRTLTPLETKLLSSDFSPDQCWVLLQATASRMKRPSGRNFSKVHWKWCYLLQCVVLCKCCLFEYQAIKLGSLIGSWVPLGVSN